MILANLGSDCHSCFQPKFVQIQILECMYLINHIHQSYGKYCCLTTVLKYDVAYSNITVNQIIDQTSRKYLYSYYKILANIVSTSSRKYSQYKILVNLILVSNCRKSSGFSQFLKYDAAYTNVTVNSTIVQNSHKYLYSQYKVLVNILSASYCKYCIPWLHQNIYRSYYNSLHLPGYRKMCFL